MTRRELEKGDMAEKGSKSEQGKKSRSIRTRVAQFLWLLCVLAALFLAVGALCIALDFNQRNALVEFAINGADVVDLEVFSRRDGIKDFAGDNAETKNALFNWGLGAVAWLVFGRIVERVVRS